MTFEEEVNKLAPEEIERLSNSNPEIQQMIREMLSLFSLDDPAFEIMSDAFKERFTNNLTLPQNRLAIVQALNINGQKYEDLAEFASAFNTEIDNIQTLTAIKKQFLKELFVAILNVIAESEGIAKRVISIPIQICDEHAKLPSYAHIDDSGMDVYAIQDYEIDPGETVLVDTGIKVAIPRGYELQVRPKSGLSLNSKLRIANAPGTVDAGYRDTIGIICDNIDAPIHDVGIVKDNEDNIVDIICDYGSSIHIAQGQKVAQLVLCEVPRCNWVETEDVASIGEDRGGGYGSTGLV